MCLFPHVAPECQRSDAPDEVFVLLETLPRIPFSLINAPFGTTGARKPVFAPELWPSEPEALPLSVRGALWFPLFTGVLLDLSPTETS